MGPAPRTGDSVRVPCCEHQLPQGNELHESQMKSSQQNTPAPVGREPVHIRGLLGVPTSPGRWVMSLCLTRVGSALFPAGGRIEGHWHNQGPAQALSVSTVELGGKLSPELGSRVHCQAGRRGPAGGRTVDSTLAGQNFA